MDKYLLPYLLIMLHFVSGALFLVRIIQKPGTDRSRKQWTKFTSYVILFNIIWNCKLFADSLFMLLAYSLMILCAVEWWRAIQKTRHTFWLAAGFSLVLAGFWRFLYLAENEILFTLFIVILFDGSSQIAGQMYGKTPLLPNISPSKTLEGLIGGTLVTLATAVLVRNSFFHGWGELVGKSILIIIFAFTGDLLASFVKRKAGLAIFGRMLPGHGGLMDRFDSLFMAGSVIFLLTLVIESLG